MDYHGNLEGDVSLHSGFGLQLNQSQFPVSWQATGVDVLVRVVVSSQSALHHIMFV